MDLLPVAAICAFLWAVALAPDVRRRVRRERRLRRWRAGPDIPAELHIQTNPEPPDWMRTGPGRWGTPR